MSLVAYASSDEGSDNENCSGGGAEVTVSNSRIAQDNDVLDFKDEKIQPSFPRRDEDFSKRSDLFGAVDIPKPKSSQFPLMNKVEEEIEDFIREKTEKLKELATPETKPTCQRRKIFQVTAPLLNDSDDDDAADGNSGEQPHKKLLTSKLPRRNKMSGLFSVLPPPKNQSLKRGKGEKIGEGTFPKLFKHEKSAGESSQYIPKPIHASQDVILPNTPAKSTSHFIPATLCRKNPQSSFSAFNLETGIMMSTKPRKPVVKTDDIRNKERDNVKRIEENSQFEREGVALEAKSSEDEDEGEEEVSNFFTINVTDESKKNLSLAGQFSAYPANRSIDSSQVKTLNVIENNSTRKTAPSLQNKPLTFTHGNFSTPNPSMQLKGVSSDYDVGHEHQLSSASTSDVYANTCYNMANCDNTKEPAMSTHLFETSHVSSQKSWNEQEFMRIQGRSNRRKEVVNFIDVCQDDQTSGVDMNMIKSLSEENTNRQSSSKKNNDLPSSQQRRKHQITYLAFKAKEREVELKDSWAANRQTRRQTQSKYGF